MREVNISDEVTLPVETHGSRPGNGIPQDEGALVLCMRRMVRAAIINDFCRC